MSGARRVLALALCGLTLCALAGCGGKAPETPTGVRVEKIDGLSEDFVMGADVSSLLSLERAGAVFRGFDGEERDALLTLSEAGVDCVRVRVWVDPYDSDGRGYGGGSCDIETAAELGARAAKYGMTLLVDFHYSDFWADPSKQQAPKAWESLSLAEKGDAIEKYTSESLQRLDEAGADVSMVQIGNETTTGFCGETRFPDMYGLMARAAAAVRAHDPETLIAVHYTNPEDGKYLSYASLLELYGVDYDVFASSYYPFWHGTLENLVTELGKVSERYDKRVMVAETSWAYTTEELDGHGNTIGEAPTYEAAYPLTVQGQSRELADVIKAVASLGERAYGVFYWEPTWIAVPAETQAEREALWEEYGCGWASSAAAEYDPDDAGRYYGGCACENQAMFDSEGRPLDSLRTFALVRTGNDVPIAIDAVETAVVTAKKNNPVVLPETVHAVYNDGATAEVEVEWEDVALTSDAVGEYTVSGTAEGFPALCRVSIEDENYLDNYSFEDADRSMWTVTTLAEGAQTDYQTKKTDAHSGEVSLHFWNAAEVGFTAEQTASGLRPGLYSFTIAAQGGDIGEGAELYIYARADGVTYTEHFALDGWVNWQSPEIKNIATETGEITAGVYVRCNGGGWGTLDDFRLCPME